MESREVNRKPGHNLPWIVVAPGAPYFQTEGGESWTLKGEVGIAGEGCVAFACGDPEQAVAWVVRADSLDRKGMLRKDAEPVRPVLFLPGLGEGRYRVTFWDTAAGRPVETAEACRCADGRLSLRLPLLRTDLAIAVRASRP